MPLLSALLTRTAQVSTKVPFQKSTPSQIQEKTLRLLLRKASGTSFGKHYDFKKILKSNNSLQQFQKDVPIFDYDTIYNNWWYRTLDQEPNVCWPGKIKLFALSSGTTGSPSKHIPITSDMIRSIRKAGVRMLMSLTNHDDVVLAQQLKHDMMMLGGSTDLTDKGGIAVGDLSGINASRLPFWLRRFYRPGAKISQLKDWNDRLEEIAKAAPTWDIGFIMGIPAWVQLMIEKILDYHQVDNIHEIWPNFSIYVTGGVAFEPYAKGFEKLLGKPVKYLDTYLASEGFMAFQKRQDTNAMALQIDNGIFFEFIPFTSENFDEDGQIKPNPKVLNISQVSKNQDYALLISTCSGAWRYLIGDTVRFTDISRCEVIITGRTKHFLSICGEHLSVDNMNNAIQLLEKEFDIHIREFTVSGVEKEGYFTHKWYIGGDKYIDNQLLTKRLDYYLSTLNDDYATERKSVLKDIIVEQVPPSVFYQWHEAFNKMGGQSKFPRVMKKEQFNTWETFVREQQVSQ